MVELAVVLVLSVLPVRDMKPADIVPERVCEAGLGADARDGMLFLFWNLENLFDWENEGLGTSEAEFSPEGERRWTKSRFWRKIHGIAKTIMWACDEYGRMPDVAGFAEVENSRVVNMLAKATLLRKFGYVTVHFDSPDPRGIDVALVYRGEVFEKVSAKTCPVKESLDGSPMATRDILLVSLKRSGGEMWHFIVNHHPSKYGGVRASAPKRKAAMAVLGHVCDSLDEAGERNVVAMGDFNDTPEGDAFSLMGDTMCNAALPLHEKGEGTIRYAGKWELIDMFLVHRSISDNARMSICRPGFLLTEDSGHSGYKPLRTYTGPRYSGGLSDHVPVVLEVK